jgi:hypothetical protein
MKGGVYMNSEEIMFQQYKLYSDQKEKFVDRSFQTNKFYLFLILGLFFMMLITKGLTFVFGLTSTLIFSVAGIAICILWWVNVDSYNFLIKVKLGKVIEEIERNYPLSHIHWNSLQLKNLEKQKENSFLQICKKYLLH